jgi:hypothetical protein
MLVQGTIRKFNPYQCVQSSTSECPATVSHNLYFAMDSLRSFSFDTCKFRLYNRLNLLHFSVFHQCFLDWCLLLVNSSKRWRDLVFEVLEKAFVQNVHIFASLYVALHTSSAFVNEDPFGSSHA